MSSASYSEKLQNRKLFASVDAQYLVNEGRLGVKHWVGQSDKRVVVVYSPELVEIRPSDARC